MESVLFRPVKLVSRKCKIEDPETTKTNAPSFCDASTNETVTFIQPKVLFKHTFIKRQAATIIKPFDQM